MADNNMFYKYQEHRGQAGYRGALLVKEQTQDKYSLFLPLESVPSFFGSPESFDFNLVNSPVKGKVQGKMEMEDSSCEFLWHRDSAWRLEQLQGKVLDFLTISGDFVGTKATGTFTYHQNEGQADVLKGTIDFSIMSGDPHPILNCRGLVQETLCFADVIPESVPASTSSEATKINLSIVQKPSSVTYKYFKIKEDNTIDGDESEISGVTNGVWEIPTTVTGLIGITVSATGYAPWTTTVFVG